MSDSGGSGAGPGGYPQGGMAPPPPPPAPGTFPGQPPYQPAPPAASGYASPPAAAPGAPKKRKTLLIVAVVVVLLTLCGLGGCAALFIAGSSSSDEKASVERAETHYTAARSAVGSASVAIEGAKSSSAATSKSAVAEAERLLRTGRDEIAAARAVMEELDDSAGKTDYLASLDAAVAALDGLEDLVAYMGTATGMFQKTKDAGAASSKAGDDLNDAISAGNARDYTKMKTKARTAYDGFAKATVLFREAHKLDKSAGLDKLAFYADKRRQQAEVVLRMADEGKAGKTSAYNKDIDLMRSMGAAAEKIADPSIVDDPEWAEKRLADLVKRIEQAGEKADQLHVSALETFGD